MPELEYFLVAESTSVDRDDNTISIFNVYNERRFEQFPATLQRVVLVTCWVASPEEITSKEDMHATVVLRVDGDNRGPYHANFKCETEFQHILFEFSDLVFAKPCLLEFDLSVNGKHAGTHRIRLIFQ